MPIKTYKREVMKRTPGPGSWSEREKLEAVTSYLMLGKWPLVVAATGIPLDTLKKWKQADWWKEMEAEVRRSSNLQLSGKLKTIREKAAEIVMDRLDNGDFKVNPRTGVISRVGIPAKEANDILVKSIDREMLLQKLEERPQVKEEAILERLTAIMETLSKQAKKTKGDIIDVEPILEEPNVQLQSILQESI